MFFHRHRRRHHFEQGEALFNVNHISELVHHAASPLDFWVLQFIFGEKRILLKLTQPSFSRPSTYRLFDFNAWCNLGDFQSWTEI